jgi:predicted Zn-dependent protease
MKWAKTALAEAWGAIIRIASSRMRDLVKEAPVNSIVRTNGVEIVFQAGRRRKTLERQSRHVYYIPALNISALRQNACLVSITRLV